jgi:hypothetical protein
VANRAGISKQVTPHVIQNFDEAKLLTQEFKEMVRNLKKIIHQ